MEDNTPRPATRGMPRVPPRPNFLRVAVIIVIGILLGQLYLAFLVPRFSVLPISYPQASFQNKTASYYDVLNISDDSSDVEIKSAYETHISKLSLMKLPPGKSAINLTLRAKVLEVEKAFQILQGRSRCLYDFEVLGLGITSTKVSNVSQVVNPFLNHKMFFEKQLFKAVVNVVYSRERKIRGGGLSKLMIEKAEVKIES
ncbi:hypothetical protein F4808DRAFT_456710 [Astrocystis sublimbata]|nr:hypothetical protein F4808DRAFT_456710 [Astrocystis sublimbata]